MTRADTSRELRDLLVEHRRGLAARLADQLELDEAIESVADNAGPVWRAHALAAVRKAAERHPELTVDDVHEHITLPVLDARALGHVMRTAARDGLIAATGEYRTSRRPATHGRPCRVWRSRLRAGP